MTGLEKARIRSIYNRINSNIKYATRIGLGQTDYYKEFHQKAIRFGVEFTKKGNVSKKSNLTFAQLKSLEESSRISSKFARKYGSTRNKKIIDVQKFLNTGVEFVYDKIKNADNEIDFRLAQKFDAMLEDGLNNYGYEEIHSILNKLGAFSTTYEYNPFLDKYPSREERKKMKFNESIKR